jgi:hypothetical protein
MTDEASIQTLGRGIRAFLGVVSGAEDPDSSKPFPDSGLDAFLSHFVFTLQLTTPKSNLIHITLPVAVQTVSRSKPFIYKGSDDVAEVPLPAGCTLSNVIKESDFPQRPDPFFTVGKQVVWLQILNLDARGETALGPIRIILGETLKREYPDLFQPSLGVAQSLGASGFPARLFFDPCAIVETKIGNFRAVHGVLSYGRINEFPPVGSAVQTTDVIPLDTVETLRAQAAAGTAAVASPKSPRVLALTHPVDAVLHLSGDEAFDLVNQSIDVTN